MRGRNGRDNRRSRSNFLRFVSRRSRTGSIRPRPCNVSSLPLSDLALFSEPLRSRQAETLLPFMSIIYRRRRICQPFARREALPRRSSGCYVPIMPLPHSGISRLGIIYETGRGDFAKKRSFPGGQGCGDGKSGEDKRVKKTGALKRRVRSVRKIFLSSFASDKGRKYTKSKGQGRDEVQFSRIDWRECPP